MGWIDDEAERAKALDDTKARRDEMYRTQAPGLWSGLKHQIRQDVEDINKNQYLLDHRLGGRTLLVQDNEGSLVVQKHFYPSIFLTMAYRSTNIEVKRETFANRDDRNPKTERHELLIGIGEDERMFFQNKDGGEKFGVPEASEMLLKPLLQNRSIQ